MKAKALRVAVVVAVLGVLAGAAVRKWRGGAIRDGTAIRVSGNIEVTDARLSFKVPGRVADRLVSEGEFVTNGQVVARLDATELGQELALRRAEEEAAAAILAELEAGSRPEEIEQGAAAAEAAKTEARHLDSDFRRQRELFEGKVISVRDYESADTARAAAAARQREAEARLALLRKGPREETLRAARARVEQARQAAALARSRMDDATLRSPLSGVVLAEGLEAGEYAAPGTPVVTVGDLDRPWLRAYIAETDLGRVRIGQAVRVTTDTAPGAAQEGRLSFISSEAEFTPRSVQTEKERVKLVYRIKVDIPNPTHMLKPGMPADGEMQAKPQSPASRFGL